MQANASDGGGIIGTPLGAEKQGSRSGSRPVRLSAADKIAPRVNLFAFAYEREAKQRERRLLADAAREEIEPSNLYEEKSLFKKGVVTADDIMDDEDRAQAYLRARTRGRREVEKSGEIQYGAVPKPFVVACTLLPEVMPRARVTAVGYDILRECRKNSIRRRAKSRFQDQNTGLLDLFSSSGQLRSSARNHGDLRGLGWSDVGRNSAMKREMFISERGKVNFSRRDIEQQRSAYGEDDFDELANAGYKDLDNANKQMMLSMRKRRHGESREDKSKRMKAMEAAGLHKSDRQPFSLFEKCEVLKVSERHNMESPESIPPEFIKNPVHDTSTRNNWLDKRLSSSLQREHARLMKQKENQLDFDSKAVRMSIATAKRKQDDKIRMIKQQFFEDMRTSFVPARGTKEDIYNNCFGGGDPVNHESATTPQAENENIPEIGTRRRTEYQWKPSPLLLKRFGIVPTEDRGQDHENTGKDNEILSSSFTHEAEDDDDFQVHSIIGADGKRIDFQHAVKAFVEDDSVLVTVAEPQKGLGTQPLSATPSTELYSAIFGAKVGETHSLKEETGARVSVEVVTQKPKETDRIARRPKAADFF